MAPNTSPADDPTGDHDPEALEDAAKRMHAHRGKDTEDANTRDPQGGHDDDALEEAAKKMEAER